MIINWKNPPIPIPGQAGISVASDEVHSQVMERAEQEKKTKRLTDVLSAVIQKQYQSVVQKTELGVKAKLPWGRCPVGKLRICWQGYISGLA